MKKLCLLVALVTALTSCGIIRERAAREQAAKEEAARLEDHHRKAAVKLNADQQTYEVLQKESDDLLAQMMQKTGSAEWESLRDKQFKVEQQLLDLSPTIISDMMDSWVGSKSDELLGKWGSPDSTFKDSQGNIVWTYEGLAGFGMYTHQTKRQFWINKNDIIFNWRWEGL